MTNIEKATVKAIRAMGLLCTVADSEYRIAMKGASPKREEDPSGWRTYTATTQEDALATAKVIAGYFTFVRDGDYSRTYISLEAARAASRKTSKDWEILDATGKRIESGMTLNLKTT
jgi:hypothetical protein